MLYLNDEIRCADPVLSKKITRKAAADGCVVDVSVNSIAFWFLARI
jgi:hypothetical protein